MNKVKILIAEDNDDERPFIKKGLIATGLFDVIALVENGQQLVDYFDGKNTRPDVILSDINMPLKTGIEALTELKQNPIVSDTLFVMYSTCVLESTQNTCKLLGANLYVTKPLSFLDYDTFGRNLHNQLKSHFPVQIPG
jgi:CheY-like chemotaxis protein